MNWLQKLLSSTPSTANSTSTPVQNAQAESVLFDELNTRVKRVCKDTVLTPKDLIQRRGVEYLIYRPSAIHIWCASSDDSMLQGAVLVALLVYADGIPLSINDALELDWKVFGELLEIISRD